MIEQKFFYEYVDKVISNNKKISHAYLIELNNNDSKNYVDYLIKCIICPNKYKKNCKLCNKCLQLDNDEYLNVKYIYPDGNIIKKDQIKDLIINYSKKSLIDGQLVYVIYDAEKMNGPAFNSLLKFLEEPSPGITAILVTNNRYSLSDTIISRCQILSLIESDSIDVEQKYIDFLDIITQSDSFTSSSYIFKDFIPSKKEAIDYLSNIKRFLVTILNTGNKDGLSKVISKKGDSEIIKYVIIIEEALNKLNYNVNYKIWLDNFLVQMMEV